MVVPGESSNSSGVARHGSNEAIHLGVPDLDATRFGPDGELRSLEKEVMREYENWVELARNERGKTTNLFDPIDTSNRISPSILREVAQLGHCTRVGTP